MKTAVIVATVVLVLVPAAFATGSALDPRVPGLQRQVRALNVRVGTLEASTARELAGKVDAGCVELLPLVERPGYLYEAADGSVIVYQAIDRFHPEFGDAGSYRVMTWRDGC